MMKLKPFKQLLFTKNKYLFFLFMVLITTGNLLAQTGRINITSQIIPYGSWHLQELSNPTIVWETGDGNQKIIEVPTGTYTLVFDIVQGHVVEPQTTPPGTWNYDTQSCPVTVNSGDNITFKVQYTECQYSSHQTAGCGNGGSLTLDRYDHQSCGTGGASINVTSSSVWNVVSDQSWVRIAKYSTMFNINLEIENNTGADRVANVQVTNNEGISKTVIVTQYGKPVIAFSGTPTSGNTPLTVNFTDNSTYGNGDPITSWNWDFGDGGTSTSKNPSHSYNITGDYNVKLIINTTLCGQSRTETKQNYISVTSSGSQDGNLLITPTTKTISSTTGIVSGSINITSNITWTATSNQNWLTFTSNSTVTGNGVLDYKCADNTSTSPRTATITFSGSGVTSKIATITQEGIGKTLAIDPATETIPSTTDIVSGSINVTSNITWTATSNQNWLTFTSNSTKTGNGVLDYKCTDNTSTDPRTATITFSGNGVANKTATITQEGSTKCTWSDCKSTTDCKSVIPEEAYLAADFLCGKGYVEGFPDGSLQPDVPIEKEDFAKVLFYAVFDGDKETPADNYPMRYEDLKTGREYYKYAKILTYLHFQDGVTPFDLDRVVFDAGKPLKRKYALKAIMEAFNIPMRDVSDITRPIFEDISDLEGTKYYAYILNAVDKKIITNKRNFNPDENITRAEVFIILHRIFKENIKVATNDELQNPANYYEPTDYNENNLALAKSLSKGNFKYFESADFFINGKMPLVFKHFYNSDLVSLAGEMTYIKPFSPGWNHNYNVYLINIQNVHGTQIPDEYKRIYVVWADGTADVFKDQSGYQGIGASRFNKLEKRTDGYYLTTKSQMVYHFKNEANHEKAPYVLRSIKDRNNNQIYLEYEDGEKKSAYNDEELEYTPKRLFQIKDKHDRSLKIGYYSGTNRIRHVFEEGILDRGILFKYTDIDVSEKGGGIKYPHLTSYQDPEGNISEYKYGDYYKIGNWKYAGDHKYLLTYIKDPKGNIYNADYSNRRANYITSRNNAGTRTVTEIEHHPSTDNTDVTQYTTDQSGNKTPNSERTYKYSFTADGKTEKVVSPTATTEVTAWYKDPETGVNFIPKTVKKQNLTFTYEYDKNTGSTLTGMGNLTKMSIQGGAYSITEEWDYNSTNDVISHKDAEGYSTIYTYTNGNLTKVTPPSPAGQTKIDRNTDGTVKKVTSPENVTIEFDDYDKYGNAWKVINPLNTIELTYDKAGRLEKSELNTGKFKKVSETVYNKNDQIIKTIISGTGLNGDIITEYPRDVNGNLDKVINAAGKETDLDYEPWTDFLKSEKFGDAVRSYTYYPNGQLKTITKPDGTVLTFYYDGVDRLKYCEIGGKKQYEFFYDGYGRIYKIETGNQKQLYEFDELNRVKKYTDWLDKSFEYTYYNSGKVRTIKYPNGLVVVYDYYPTGWLKNVKWNSYTITYSYFSDGKLEKTEYPNGYSDTYTYHFDKGGLLKSKIIKDDNNKMLAIYGYTYDNAGNIDDEILWEPEMSKPNDKPVFGTTRFSFDDYNRLTKISAPRESLKVEIDKNGNTKKIGSETYTFDEFDRITEINAAETNKYAYDAFGGRHIANRNGIVTMYTLGLGGEVLSEKNTKTNETYNYIHGLGMLARTKDNKVWFYFHDIRGSIIFMADENGAMTHQYAYDETGKVINIVEPNDDTNLFRFVGKYGVTYENENTYYMHARFYDVRSQRFLSEDPIWNTNLYTYASNNSIQGIDPYGASTCDINNACCTDNSTNMIKLSAPFASTMKNIKQIFTKLGKHRELYYNANETVHHLFVRNSWNVPAWLKNNPANTVPMSYWEHTAIHGFKIGFKGHAPSTLSMASKLKYSAKVTARVAGKVLGTLATVLNVYEVGRNTVGVIQGRNMIDEGVEDWSNLFQWIGIEDDFERFLKKLVYGSPKG